jgi:long-chain acyl-CoA synthetase
MNPITQQQAWSTLFADPELGAGNFLTKSVAAYGQLDADFLFLEKAFVGSSGESHQAFSLNSLHQQVKHLAGWYLSQGISAGCHVCLYLESVRK